MHYPTERQAHDCSGGERVSLRDRPRVAEFPHTATRDGTVQKLLLHSVDAKGILLAERRILRDRQSTEASKVVLLRDVEAGPFYFVETNLQQYLAKNPHGYCGIGGTGVECTIGTGVGA